jgi:hypothetical protein
MQKTAKTEVTTTSKPATKAVAKITPTVVKTVKVSRTKMSELLKANSGKFVSIVFVKQDGTVRKINGKASAKDYFTPLGYIKYKDSKNNYKLVDPRTTQELHCSGVIYKV